MRFSLSLIAVGQHQPVLTFLKFSGTGALPPALLPVFPAHKLALDFYRILLYIYKYAKLSRTLTRVALRAGRIEARIEIIKMATNQ
jgi:hypothetical protein